jgi:hypothetical protein
VEIDWAADSAFRFSPIRQGRQMPADVAPTELGISIRYGTTKMSPAGADFECRATLDCLAVLRAPENNLAKEGRVRYQVSISFQPEF